MPPSSESSSSSATSSSSSSWSSTSSAASGNSSSSSSSSKKKGEIETTCGECEQERQGREKCDDTSTSGTRTVRYATGEIVYSVTDIASGGYGLPWSHSRTFNNINSAGIDEGQGVNWDIPNLPFISNTRDEIYAILGDPLTMLWFERTPGEEPPAGDTYDPLYGNRSTLVHNDSTKKYTLYKSDGTTMVFNDLTVSPRPGALLSHTTPGGSTTAIEYDTSGNVDYVYRSYTSGTDTIREEFFYDYDVSGTHITRVTLRRKVNSGSWNNILKVEYTYYGTGSDFGLPNDLESATHHEWNGSSWDSLGVYYYRYWTNDYQQSPLIPGMKHGLKYVVEPAAYALMEDNSIDPQDPNTSDATLSLYADKYFEYDAQRRVTKERVNGGSSTYTLSFSLNPNYSSGAAHDFNFWKTKTEETLPDGTKNIVFTNNHGLTMLFVTKSGSDEWCRFTRFDAEGRYILRATPAAVSGYDQAYNDLLNYNSVTGKFAFLRDSAGLINLYEYYDTTGSGAAYGFRSCYKIQEGQTGTPIKTHEWEYTSHTANNATVYPVSKERVFRNTDGTGAIETQYSYSFHSGTTEVEKKTTTLPVIPTSQNGSGTANSFEDVYDTYGNHIWHKDERGFITRYKYDIVTGAMTQQIEDVDTTQVSDEPTGWSTPSGGGLHLVTDYKFDDRGRITQTLGPAHDIDLNGTSTEIRTATWTVYKDYENRQVTAQGFQKTSDESFTLVNPVSITKRDKNGNVREEIQATRASTSGKLQASDTFAQSSYTRWTTYQYTECCKLESMRVYYDIPASGEGTLNTHYNKTEYGYDLRNRRNRKVTPDGTILFTVFDERGLTKSGYVGTNDFGATETDPTGGGATGNNMVIVMANEYDNGNDGGNGHLTMMVDYVSASETRVTTYSYDFRDRRTEIDGEIDFYQKMYYDNLNNIIKIERYNTTPSGNLIDREEAKYDDLGRVYETIRYAVDPSDGSIGENLKDQTWYDASGNYLKRTLAGSKLFTKYQYDGLNRETESYTGYDLNESTYSEAGSVTGNTILEQSTTTYDDANNSIAVAVYQRFHNATGTGKLNGPSGTQPKARVSYIATWSDGVGRQIASANYGTNGGSSFTRTSTVPARSDDILVTTTEFSDTGNVLETKDPAGTVTRFEYDDVGRETKVIENYVSVSSSSSSNSSGSGCPDSEDTNRTTEFAFNADGKLKTLTTININTGNQVTSYEYGTTLTDSEVATSTLLRSIKYPDSTSASDSVKYEYNRQAELTSIVDQRGNVHNIDYDKLGRSTEDRVTTLGTGVDATILRISARFNARGLIETLTSYDDASVGLGNVVNEIKNAYNDFGQLITQYQEHVGAVNTSTTPRVQYSYADGSNNTIRPISIIYPDTREITYDYGSSNGINDAASRVESLVDDDSNSTHLAEYEYLGVSSIVEVDYTEPEIRSRLFDPSGSGDIYTSLDRFGRVVDYHWYNYGDSTSAARIKYGHDRASNRLWREDVVAGIAGKHFDELYTYDGLHRLKNMQRGTLNANKDTVTNLQFGQCWSLDSVGNWDTFHSDDNGDGTWDLIQNRSTNKVNEVTDLTETTGPSWVTPAYDLAGNMTTIPIPDDPSSSYKATYDAWNQLVKLEEDDGSGGLQTVQENEYDLRRFRIVRKDYVDGVHDETRHFFYTANWQSIEERLGSSSNSVTQYVWGVRSVDDCVLRDRDTNEDGSFDERLYGLQDANWNMIAESDDGGNVQERCLYSPFGTPEFHDPTWNALTSSVLDWVKLHAGCSWDESTALYHVRNRYLHELLGLWITRDPIGYSGSSLNLYLYLNDDPVNNQDPSGLQQAPTHQIDLSGLMESAGRQGHPGQPGGMLGYPGQGGAQPARPDWEKLKKCCPECMDDINTLKDLVDKAEEAKLDRSLGPCGTFANEFQTQKIKDNPKFKCFTVTKKYYHIIPPIKRWHGLSYKANYHVMFTVEYKCKDKSGIFYLDAGTKWGGAGTGNIGGDDNIYWGELPSCLVPTQGTGDSFPTDKEFNQLYNEYKAEQRRKWRESYDSNPFNGLP